MLRLHQGHLLLIGLNGSGKRSLAKLSSISSNAEYYEPKINKKYGSKDFRIDFIEFMQNVVSKN